MKIKRKITRRIAKRANVIVSMAMVLTQQLSPFIHHASANAPDRTQVTYLTIPTGKKYQMDFGDQYIIEIDGWNTYDSQGYHLGNINITTGAGNVLTIEPLRAGSAFFGVNLYDKGEGKTLNFVISVVDSGTDKTLDIGDIVKYISANASSVAVNDIKNVLHSLEPVLYPTAPTVTINFAPMALESHSVIVYNPTSAAYASNVSSLYSGFFDANGTSDLVGFTIVQAPNPASGMSVAISGSTLYFGGTPTMPASFVVRGTDSKGLYAEQTYKVNFTPESLGARPAIGKTGATTSVDLSGYFGDRDGDILNYWVAGFGEGHWTTISGSILSVWGDATASVRILVGANDGFSSYAAFNTISLVAQNIAPVALSSQSVIVYNPTSAAYASSVSSLYSRFYDANGRNDLVGFTIVQAPNPASGMSVSISGSTLYFGGTPTMPASFVVRATDSKGQYADQTYQVNFTPESTGAQPTIAITGAPMSIDIGGFFLDRDGDALSYFVDGVTGPHWAYTNGSVLYIDGNATKPAQVRIGAYDRHSTYTAFNTVSFAAQNFAPVALSSQLVVAFNPASAAYVSSESSLYSSFYDPNGTNDIIGFTIVQAPNPASGMSVAISGSTLYFGGTPTMPASFVVRATDSKGQYADQTYKVNFTPESTGAQPTIAITGATMSVDISGYFTDRDGDALSYNVEGVRGAGGHWAYTSGTVLYIGGNAAYPVLVRVGAYDRFSGYAAYNTVSFAGQNIAPVALSSQSVVVYNPTSAAYASSARSLYLGFYDANGTSDLIGFTIVQAPNPASGMSVAISGSTLYFGGTPTMPASFVVRATDSKGQYADQTYKVNFTPESTGAQPTIAITGATMTVDISGYFVDRDGDILNYFVNGVTGPHWAYTVGSVLYIGGNAAEPAQVRVGAYDRFSGHTAYNTISFTGQNVAPVALSSQSVIVYNPTSAAYASNVSDLYSSFYDANGRDDMVGFTIVQAPNPASGMSVAISGSTLYFGGTPTMPASFVVRATDSNGHYAEKTYAINFTPEAVAQPTIRSSGAIVSVDLSGYFTDRDGDWLSYSIIEADDRRSARLEGSKLIVTGWPFTPFNLLVGATDRHSSYTALNTVNFAALNVAPYALSSQSIFVYNPTSAAYASNVSSLYSRFYDANGLSDLVNFEIIQAPNPASGMSAAISGSTLYFGGTPTMPASFVVRATDSQGLYADHTYAVNFTPEAVSQPIVRSSGAFVTVDVSHYFTDRDGDSLNYMITDSGNAYSAWLDGNILHAWGEDESLYQVRVGAFDGFSSYTAINTVSIVGQNVAPVSLSSQSVVVYNPTSVAYASSVSSLYSSFYDANGLSDLVNFEIIQAPNPASGMSAAISGSTLYFGGTPTMPASFVVRATDSQGLYADHTYAVNFTPEAVAQPIVRMSGTLVSVDMSQYFTDRDGDRLNYRIFNPGDAEHRIWFDGNILQAWSEDVALYQVRIGAFDEFSSYTAINTVSIVGQNVAPVATSSVSIIQYNPTSAVFASNVTSLYASFFDANGISDLVNFEIIQAPDPASGLSVSINDSSLIFGGTPTMPTSFVVRATDSHGLYADKTYALNFAPEAIHGPSIFTTGSLTYIDLNNYFIDRDGDPLSIYFDGPYSSAYNIIQGTNSLSISGVTMPLVLNIWALDGRGGWSYGSVRINQ